MIIPVPTPNPAEFAIHVRVPAHDLTQARMPAVGSTYAAFALCDQDRTAEFGTYKFTHLVSGSPEGVVLNFVRPKTQAERYLPFRQTPGKRVFTWPLMLLDSPRFEFDPSLIMYQDPSSDLYSGTYGIRRLWVKEKWVPALTCQSDVLIEEFLSDEPYPSDVLITRAYVQTPVEYNYPGCERHGFPACIHGDIDLPGYDEPYLSRSSGYDPKPSIYIPPQRIPATPMATWMMHVMEDDQVLTPDHQWHRTRITVYPPAPPRPEQTLS